MSFWYEYFTNNLGNILLTRKQVADELKVEAATLDLWDKENKLNLPEVTKEGERRYYYIDVMDFKNKYNSYGS